MFTLYVSLVSIIGVSVFYLIVSGARKKAAGKKNKNLSES
jgi:hypothetical protein